MASILERVRALKAEIAQPAAGDFRDGRGLAFGMRIASLAADLYGEGTPRHEDARRAVDDFAHGRGGFGPNWAKLMAIRETMEKDAESTPEREARSDMRAALTDAAESRQVFISYTRSDSGFVGELQVKVKEVGYTAWIDRLNLRGGTHWREAIDQEIRKSFALVVVMTPAAKKSDYVTYEWAYALGAGVRVIPLLLQKTPRLHRRLIDIHHVDFQNHPLPWKDLEDALQSALDDRGPPPTARGERSALVIPPRLAKVQQEMDGFLKRVYAATGPNPHNGIQFGQLAQRMDWTQDKAMEVFQRLEARGLAYCEVNGEFSLTHAGIDRAEELLADEET